MRVEVAAVVKRGKGHSQQRPRRPRRRLMIWRMGTGRTAGSRFVVRKSQKSFGQKKAKMEAAVWSVWSCQSVSRSVGQWMDGCRWGKLGENVQAAAVRIMRRAQWFLISLPITWAMVESNCYRR